MTNNTLIHALIVLPSLSMPLTAISTSGLAATDAVHANNSASVAGSWIPFAGGITSDNGTGRAVTDPNAAKNRKFYGVGVSKP